MLLDYHELKIGKYELPSWDGLVYPTLLFLSDGKVHKKREVEAGVIDQIGLPNELRNLTYQKNNSNIIEDRLSWALSIMTIANMLNRSQRGQYQINELGKNLLKKYGIRLDMNVIHKQKAYIEHRQKMSTQANNQSLNEKNENQAPVDNMIEIDQRVKDINDQIAAELLELILDNEPRFFEHLVVDLLSQMGYLGENGFSKVTSLSHDGGIDGIINQDPLGTRVIYLQAKRYSSHHSVSAPEIQSFHGALSMRHADHGVFITTSDFTTGAREAAKSLSISLVNGHQLAQLMIKYEVGVRVKNEYKIYDVDRDYFD
ncbi:restriction endonuclease [Liquorilactobacillus vini]|uniref:restriction endonuclease n=1 Tax=Liquorilactobacillus vini TaxID=238015 RepID=UPI000319F296|nr:restriction endonuclease [Liquorilactobacillus vini]